MHEQQNIKKQKESWSIFSHTKQPTYTHSYTLKNAHNLSHSPEYIFML